MTTAIPVLRHVAHEHMGAIENSFRRKGVPFRYVDVWTRGFRWPDANRVPGLVVMGGPMGVYEQDKVPFLRPELRLIQAVLKRGVPVLGICLGSQLMASALGAGVRKHTRKEIGWYKVRLTDEAPGDPMFRGLPRSFTTFQWHGDTFDVPDGARRLAGSAVCRNQAFRWGERAWGLQFHPEVDGEMIDRWLREPGADDELAKAFGPRRSAAIRAGSGRRQAEQDRIAQTMFDRFAGFLR